MRKILLSVDRIFTVISICFKIINWICVTYLAIGGIRNYSDCSTLHCTSYSVGIISNKHYNDICLLGCSKPLTRCLHNGLLLKSEIRYTYLTEINICCWNFYLRDRYFHSKLTALCYPYMLRMIAPRQCLVPLLIPCLYCWHTLTDYATVDTFADYIAILEFDTISGRASAKLETHFFF